MYRSCTIGQPAVLGGNGDFTQKLLNGHFECKDDVTPIITGTRLDLICAGTSSRSFLLSFSASRCVTSKDKVGCFGFLMAGEAGFHESRVRGFAVLEVTEPPAARGDVLC
jgi:hypothetical protein